MSALTSRTWLVHLATNEVYGTYTAWIQDVCPGADLAPEWQQEGNLQTVVLDTVYGLRQVLEESELNRLWPLKD